jgi:hypothetical protein
MWFNHLAQEIQENKFLVGSSVLAALIHFLLEAI